MKKGVAYWDKKLIGNGGVVNNYVKWRDATSVFYDEVTGKAYPIAPCITCKKPAMKLSLNAGHWISRRNKGVAYDEHNLHAQCVGCNKYRNGEPQIYEDELRRLYGDEETDRIRSWVGVTKKWKPYELEEMYNDYKKKLEIVKKKKM